MTKSWGFSPAFVILLKLLKVNKNMKKEYAYHCTNINPDIIIKQGFKSGKGGYTINNVVKSFYEKYLPSNPMFVSSKTVKVWDFESKYCLTIDITGLQKYPDFGHLLDFWAYVDEDNECFWWEDKHIRAIANRFEPEAKNLGKFVMNELDDNTLYASDFTGDMSFNILGTCCIDGNLLTPNRIIDIRQR